MHRQTKCFAFVAILLLTAIGSARASPQLTLDLGDYAKITTSNGGTTFTDVGYLPVEGVSFGGTPVSLAILGGLGGSGSGAYFQYAGVGTQTLSPTGLPQTASYSQLIYQLVVYRGSAAFSFDANGNPIRTGNVSTAFVLGQGSLISGSLSFVPTSPTAVSIEGTLSATFSPAVLQSVIPPTTVALTINHPPSDYRFTSPSTIQIAASSGATAAFGGLATRKADTAVLSSLPDPPTSVLGGLADPPAPVPEPASLLVVGAALMGLGIGRRRMRRGPSPAGEA